MYISLNVVIWHALYLYTLFLSLCKYVCNSQRPYEIFFMLNDFDYNLSNALSNSFYV